jgi:hypothetical protein
MYYPKSQIKTNLYTDGDDYVLSTTQKEYKGYYYKVSTGQKYTGKSPQDKPNILLIHVPHDPNEEFVGVGDRRNMPITFELPYNNSPQNIRFIPLFNPTLPTDQDKQNGQFNRYFCKKTNELKYLEIDKETYQQLQKRDSKIAWDLYTPVIVLWIIQGNQTQVFTSNKGTVQTIENNLQWHGFTQYFQDKFLKYYLGS